ncbi:hypothetical protein BJ742DRAFT_887663 [Cladochytrium replicatum]|nr:hypothetical protein BJ742DRAFT_887663 [Cladochytrium replicatum]
MYLNLLDNVVLWRLKYKILQYVAVAMNRVASAELTTAQLDVVSDWMVVPAEYESSNLLCKLGNFCCDIIGIALKASEPDMRTESNDPYKSGGRFSGCSKEARILEQEPEEKEDEMNFEEMLRILTKPCSSSAAGTKMLLLQLKKWKEVASLELSRTFLKTVKDNTSVLPEENSDEWTGEDSEMFVKKEKKSKKLKPAKTLLLLLMLAPPELLLVVGRPTYCCIRDLVVEAMRLSFNLMFNPTKEHNNNKLNDSLTQPILEEVWPPSPLSQSQITYLFQPISGFFIGFCQRQPASQVIMGYVRDSTQTLYELHIAHVKVA